MEGDRLICALGVYSQNSSKAPIFEAGFLTETLLYPSWATAAGAAPFARLILRRRLGDAVARTASPESSALSGPIVTGTDHPDANPVRPLVEDCLSMGATSGGTWVLPVALGKSSAL